MNEQQITELFRDEWSTIEVGPAPVDAVVSTSGRHRRHIVTSVTLGLAAVLALAVVLAVSIGGPPDVEPVDTVVRTEQNPLDVAWVTGDELHLESVVAEVPATGGRTEVASLAQVPEGDSYGVVYSDLDGPVVHVAADGTAVTIDDAGTPVGVVGSGTSARVAWVDRSGETPELVVWDTDSSEQVIRLPLPYDEPDEGAEVERGYVLAIDGETIYVRTPDQDLFWQPDMGAAEPVELAGGRRILDAAGGSVLTVNQELDQLQLDDGDAQAVTFSGGYGAKLSPDGQFLFPASPLGLGVRGGPEVLRSATGEPIDFDVEPDDVVLDTWLGSETATFVMGRDFVIPEDIEEDRGGYRQVLLVTCTLIDGSCEVVVEDLETPATSLSPVHFAG